MNLFLRLIQFKFYLTQGFNDTLIFLFIHLPFLRVSSPFESLDWGLTQVRATASYLNEGLVAATISNLLSNQYGNPERGFEPGT